MRFSIFLLQTSHFVFFVLFVAKCDCLELLITPYSAYSSWPSLTVNRADSFTVYLVSHQNSLDLTWQSFQLTQSAPQTLLDSFVSRRIKLLTVTYVRWWRQQWNRAKTNQKALTWGRTDQFGNTFLMRLWTLTCDLVLRAWRRHCQDSVKLNQRAIYLDERSFSSEVIFQTHRHRHTHTHTWPIALPVPLKWSVKSLTVDSLPSRCTVL